MSIGIYDFDFFNYPEVVPNLECAKLLAYYRNHNQITVLTDRLNPYAYSKFFIRKDYDDGTVFPKELISNCEIGGRYFSGEKYLSFSKEIELTKPDFYAYQKFIDLFSVVPSYRDRLKRVLNCAHFRFAPDSKNLLPLEFLKSQIEKKQSGLFAHDFNLASIKSASDLIVELQGSFLKQNNETRLPFGNKFPLKIYEYSDLQKWCQIKFIPDAFFLQYEGIMDTENLISFSESCPHICARTFYNISFGCFDENDFLINRAPIIFLQSLILRRNKKKILLTYDRNILIKKIVKDFITLLNLFLDFRCDDGCGDSTITMFRFVKYWTKIHPTGAGLSTEEIRQVFRFFEETNPELFKAFYDLQSVDFIGGKYINDRRRNKTTN